MGTKNDKGNVSIERIGKRIRLRWRYQTKRYSLNLFYFSKTNVIQAKLVSLHIETDLANGLFDASLKRYRPIELQDQIPAPKSLIQHFEDWVKNYRNMDCEKDVDYNSTRNMLLRWGKFNSSTVLFHLNRETFSARTYNRRLTLLKAFFTWTAKNKITEDNPLDDVIARKTNRTPKLNRKPFMEDEIKRILEAIKNDTFSSPFSSFKHSHYYPFVFFMFKTGVRNAEAVGLRVQHISVSEKVIHIREVLARTLRGTNAAVRVRKETKKWEATCSAINGRFI